MMNFYFGQYKTSQSQLEAGQQLQRYLLPRTRVGVASVIISLCCSNALFAQDKDTKRSWDLGIAVGYGERSNPLVNGEDIDVNAVVDFSWTGKRFYFDNGDFGYTFLERRSYAFNFVAT